VLAGLIALSPLLGAGFLWDDDLYIYGNPLIRSSGGLRDIWFSTRPVDYYPLSNSLLWLEWQLWGGNPAGYHLVNLLLHVATAVLLFRLLRRLDVPGAWPAALLFAVHPVNVAAVGWAAQTKTLLAALLGTAALLCWSASLSGEGERSLPAWCAVVLYVAALLAKTSVVALPAVMGVLVWWKRRRLRRYVSPLAAALLVGVVLGLVTCWFQYHRAMPPHLQGVRPLSRRVVSAVHAVWFYLSKAILPVRLSWMYAPWDGLPWTVPLLEGILLAGLLGWCWRGRSREPARGLLAGSLSFLALMFPVLGLLDVGYLTYAPVADHWLYTGIPPLLAMEAAALAWGWRSTRRAVRYGATVAMAGLVLWYGAASWARARLFSDPERLWEQAAARYPGAWFAHLWLGNQRLEQGEIEQALHYFERVKRMRPDWPALWVNYGIALARLGREEEAEAALRRALRLAPDSPFAHYNLGLLYRKQGKEAAARAEWEQALRLVPEDVSTLQSLADLLAHSPDGRVRDPGRAVMLARRACDLTGWRVPGLLRTLAECYEAAGLTNRARQVMQRLRESAR